MDWMDKSMVTSEISLLLERMDQERGRVYWRSFSENVHIPPLVWLNATKVRLGRYTHMSHDGAVNDQKEPSGRGSFRE